MHEKPVLARGRKQIRQRLNYPVQRVQANYCCSAGKYFLTLKKSNFFLILSYSMGNLFSTNKIQILAKNVL